MLHACDGTVLLNKQPIDNLPIEGRQQDAENTRLSIRGSHCRAEGELQHDEHAFNCTDV